ncbi:MAG: protein kinase [Alphaproteobacteria bacterium]|nr:protein kinase [Alphaproteobacteria bacterium]
MARGSDGLEALALALLEQAFDAPSNEREALILRAAGDDAALRERTLALLRADASPDVAAITGGAVEAFGRTVEAHPDRVGPYRLERLIGRGGMGAVYLGRRDAGDFDHEVAIKFVTGGRNRTRLAERLRTERQTLAKLKHAGIAQLYDGGETDDGVPYLIMEHVPGEPLGDWLAAGDRSMESRLDVFGDACSAVAYAHQNLVVHRDLTPMNILVTDDLRAKVIDFGISRTLGEGRDADAPRRTATKGYTPPERAEGDDATTLGDIYALGRVLSDLLQGMPRNADLAAIAAKAAADAPGDRYASVGALIEDLDRARAGLPVVARQGGFGYVAAKFILRRKFAVAAGAAAAVGVLAAAIVFAALFVRAESAEAEATARYNDVRNLARAVIFDVYDAVSPLPGSTQARRIVVEAAQTYLDRLADDADAAPDLLLETAEGYAELGRILGSPDGAALGDAAAAAASLEKAIALYERAATPPTAAALLGLGRAHYDLARIAVDRRSDDNLAARHLDQSAAHLRNGLDIAPQDTDLQLALLSTRAEAATLTYRADDQERARAMSRAVIADGEALRDRAPDDASVHSLLGDARTRLALSLLNDQETRAEAPALYLAALEDHERAYELSGGDNALNGARGGAYRRYANALYLNEKHEDSVTAFRQAEAILEDIVTMDPNDRNAALSLRIIKGEMTAPLSSLERFEEAEALLLDAWDWYKSEAEASPADAVKQRRVWVHLYFMASHYRVRGDERTSCRHIENMAQVTAERQAAGGLADVDAGNWDIIKREYAACFADEPA